MPSVSPAASVPHVLIAGGGIAALEAVLALRAVSTRQTLRITILAPNRDVAYPPLAVMAAFAPVPSAGLLATFARDTDAEVRAGSLEAVDVDTRTAYDDAEEALGYDALLVAIGARTEGPPRGAVPFRGSRDAAAVGRAVEDLRGGGVLALVVPPSVSWSLPAYELALLATARLGAGPSPTVRVVTAEPAALSAFGSPGTAMIERKLAAHGVVLHTDATVARIAPGWLLLEDGRRLAAERVVALPVLAGRPIRGLGVGDGFLRVDDDGRVRASPRVYAAGDITAGRHKQGGLACQQADAAAAAIAADLGVREATVPERPVLRGVLVSGDAPEELRRTLDARTDAPGDALLRPVARTGGWTGGKVVGRYLGPYLAAQADGPGGPQAPLRLGAR